MYPNVDSIWFKSLENLFRILPTGVISKYKLTGAPSIFSSISLCNFLVAFQLENKNRLDLHTTDKLAANVNPKLNKL